MYLHEPPLPRARRRLPGGRWSPLAGALFGLALAACSSPGSDSPPIDEPDVAGDVAVDPTAWNQAMSLDQLIAYAASLGIELVEAGASSEVTKEAVVEALEKHTGCGCFGAECGTGECGHECGSCAEGECFAGQCEEPHTCPMVDMTAFDQQAYMTSDTETLKFRYEADLQGGEIEKLRIYWNTRVDEPLVPGTYDLRHRKMGDCKPCVAAYKQCGETSCEYAYVARHGIVEISEVQADGSFKGSISEFRLESAYEDPKTGIFSLIPPQPPLFGEVCVQDVSFEAPVAFTEVGPMDCDPEGNGITIGSKLRDFELQNCNGEYVNFHARCGTKALLLIGAAGW